jgi:hypothetical protein
MLVDMDWQMLQALMAGNTLPDILFRASPTFGMALVDAGAAWDFSDIPELKRLFPNFTARLDQWGSFEAWYENATTYNNTHIYITDGINPTALNKLWATYKGTTFARKSYNMSFGSPYSKYLRDDILTRIFPGARTDAQQEQFFLTKFNYDNPTGTSDPYSDIPINSMDDLLSYMKKAKEIIDRENLKDGSGKDKMIVAQLNASNGNPQSIMWSNITMYGYWWVEPPFRVADKVAYNFQGPWVKDVLSWWNRLYGDGLLDPEVFVKTDEQLTDEIVRGRFAIFPSWGSWGRDARAYAREHGLRYGLRELPNWWPITMKNTYNDGSNQWVSYSRITDKAMIITKNVNEKDLVQVANWLDYHYSEEFDILRTWGPPSFSSGVGKDRRFKPAYKDLENFQAYGVAGGKDGFYYGILANSAYPDIPIEALNPEIQIGAFCRSYPLAPMYVYPRRKALGMDYDGEMLSVWSGYQMEKLINYFPMRGWSDADLVYLPEFQRIQYMFFWEAGFGTRIAEAIRGSTKGFESNYAAYQKVFRDNDYDKGIQEYQVKWKEIFDKYIRQYWKQ